MFLYIISIIVFVIINNFRFLYAFYVSFFNIFPTVRKKYCYLV